MSAHQQIVDCLESDEQGVALLEVLVAVLVFTVGVVSTAQLFSLATQSGRRAREWSFEAVLAQQRLQQLHATPFESLDVLPADAWLRTTPGAVDFLDEAGRPAGTGTPEPSAIYIRRWTVQPLPGHAGRALVLQVSVARLRREGAGTADLRPDELSRVVAARMRNTP